MNVRSFLPTLYCGVSLIHPCLAQQGSALESQDLTALRAAYNAQVKTLSEQYRTKLDTLAKTQVQQGDVGAAVATRDELKKLDLPANTGGSAAPHVETNPFYSGTKWWENNGTSIIEFKSDGTWSECYSQCEFFGRWKTNDLYNSVTVTMPDGNTRNYSVSADGSTCTRVGDKLLYQKMATYFRTEAIAGTSVVGKAPIPLAASPYSGSRWETLNGKAVIEFKPDGSWVEHWEGKDTPGKWTTTPIKTEVKVTWPKSESLIFVISDDGLFSVRTNDHKIFKLVLQKGTAPSGNSGKGGSNPFGSR